MLEPGQLRQGTKTYQGWNLPSSPCSLEAGKGDLSSLVATNLQCVCQWYAEYLLRVGIETVGPHH
jgi:hypothetical protein